MLNHPHEGAAYLLAPANNSKSWMACGANTEGLIKKGTGMRITGKANKCASSSVGKYSNLEWNVHSFTLAWHLRSDHRGPRSCKHYTLQG
jgi:hypothetical protein